MQTICSLTAIMETWHFRIHSCQNDVYVKKEKLIKYVYVKKKKLIKFENVGQFSIFIRRIVKLVGGSLNLPNG